MKSHSPHSCSCKGSKFRGVASVHTARPAKKHEKPDEEILTAPDLISYDQFPFLIDYVCEVFPSQFFFQGRIQISQKTGSKHLLCISGVCVFLLAIFPFFASFFIFKFFHVRAELSYDQTAPQTASTETNKQTCVGIIYKTGRSKGHVFNSNHPQPHSQFGAGG